MGYATEEKKEEDFMVLPATGFAALTRGYYYLTTPWSEEGTTCRAPTRKIVGIAELIASLYRDELRMEMLPSENLQNWKFVSEPVWGSLENSLTSYFTGIYDNNLALQYSWYFQCMKIQ